MRLIRGQTSISVPKNNFRFSGKPRQPTPRQDQNRPHVQFPQSAHIESKELAPTFLRREVASIVFLGLLARNSIAFVPFSVDRLSDIGLRWAFPAESRSVQIVDVGSTCRNLCLCLVERVY